MNNYVEPLKDMSYEERLTKIKALKSELDKDENNQERSDALNTEILRFIQFNAYDDLWDIIYGKGLSQVIVGSREDWEKGRIPHCFVKFAKLVEERTDKNNEFVLNAIQHTGNRTP